MALERAKFMETPLQSSSQSRGLPGLPPLPSSDKEQSNLYQIVLRHSEHPPIMKGTSWTLASPFKEQKYHRSPSESIGNNYTPTACDLKMRDLPKLQKQRTLSNGHAVTDMRKPKVPDISPRSKKLRTEAWTADKSNGHARHGSESPEELLDLPMSRPMSPTEQMDVILYMEEKQAEVDKEPSERDMERYWYYISKGIKKEMLAPPPECQMPNIRRLIPSQLLKKPAFGEMIGELNVEVNSDYELSLRKSIVDYILKDPSEKERLHIDWTPKPSPQRVIRAPVPWSESYKQAKEYDNTHLFTTNQLMLELQNIWFDQFSHLRLVNLQELLDAELPLLPSEFESLVTKQCWNAHDILEKKWIPTCAKMFLDKPELWQPLVPPGDNDPTDLVQELFSCVAALMSIQLRSMVINTLADFLTFFQIHEAGNDFGTEFSELQYVMKQVMIVKLRVEEPKIIFEPPFRECRDIILRCFSVIIQCGEGIPRVECELFPELKAQRLVLRSVKLEETLVTEYMDKAMEIFKKNTLGPQKYLNMYKKYAELLNNKAEQDVSAFLKESHSIQAFKQKIDSYRELKDEIALLRITVPLSMFCLDCQALNAELCHRAQKLRDRLVAFEVDENRDLNKAICKRYDEMADRVNEIPSTTEGLVELQQYFQSCREKHAEILKREVDKAADTLLSIIENAHFSHEDIKLNSTVFHWPEHIKTVFELSQSRLTNRREHAEDELKRKVSSFEEKLEIFNKEVESYRKKEIMSTDEMKNNVEALGKLHANLEAAREELEQINKEETLLEYEQSQFPQLQVMFSAKEPYDKLWNTALNFHQQHEAWMNGSFQDLNAETIDDEVSEMSRNMYKLTKTFSDQPGPRRIADSIKGKIDKFKQHMPILHTICNAGIKDRHWDLMSDIVGFNIKPDAETSLYHMLEYGLNKHLEKLEEIGGAASKEHSLEKAMEKMKFEWKDMLFEFMPYRDTGVSILSAIDDIQVLLDDHIIKAQTMMGSPFIKPFEAEMKEWVDKLTTMQDILDGWLKCQATWLYLEPIFSSEDIMAQMPEEGRKFGIVDSYWRDIMTEAVK
ncbi:unnamed protein product, partial [Owenia fusiformis]